MFEFELEEVLHAKRATICVKVEPPGNRRWRPVIAQFVFTSNRTMALGPAGRPSTATVMSGADDATSRPAGLGGHTPPLPTCLPRLRCLRRKWDAHAIAT
jgi:hypothetical protein